MNRPFANNVMSVANNNVKVAEFQGADIKYGSIGICLTNTGSTKARVKIYISMVDAPPTSTLVEYNIELDANGGGYSRSFQIVVPGEKVILWADSSDVAVRVSGLLEVA